MCVCVCVYLCLAWCICVVYGECVCVVSVSVCGECMCVFYVADFAEGLGPRHDHITYHHSRQVKIDLRFSKGFLSPSCVLEMFAQPLTVLQCFSASASILLPWFVHPSSQPCYSYLTQSSLVRYLFLYTKICP